MCIPFQDGVVRNQLFKNLQNGPPKDPALSVTVPDQQSLIMLQQASMMHSRHTRSDDGSITPLQLEFKRLVNTQSLSRRLQETAGTSGGKYRNQCLRTETYKHATNNKATENKQTDWQSKQNM